MITTFRVGPEKDSRHSRYLNKVKPRMVPCNSLLYIGVFFIGGIEMIELNDRPIEWLCTRIKELDEDNLRKILSEEILKRTLSVRTIDEEAVRIALEYCSYAKLADLIKSPNPCVASLVYVEYENRIGNPRIRGLVHENGETVKILTKKDRFDSGMKKKRR